MMISSFPILFCSYPRVNRNVKKDGILVRLAKSSFFMRANCIYESRYLSTEILWTASSTVFLAIAYGFLRTLSEDATPTCKYSEYHEQTTTPTGMISVL